MTVLCTFSDLQGSLLSINTYFWYCQHIESIIDRYLWSQYKIANNLYIHSVKITHGDPGNYKNSRLNTTS